MRKQFSAALTLVAAAFMLSASFTSCGDVAEEERWTNFTLLPNERSEDNIVQIGGTATDSPKNVLIEDFTGQRCINCPEAASAISGLQASLTIGEASRIVAVAIHGGNMALAEDSIVGGLGLANEQGMAYHTYWQIDSWPMGIVDRQGGPVKYTEWSSRAVGRLSDAPLCQINVKTYIDPNAADSTCSDLRIVVNGRFMNDAPEKAMLQVWLTESDIHSLQFMPDGSRDAAYVHNHVFRAAVNGPWGEEINKTLRISKVYTFTAKPYWNIDNLAVVAFLYTEADGVLQVVEKPIEDED